MCKCIGTSHTFVTMGSVAFEIGDSLEIKMRKVHFCIAIKNRCVWAAWIYCCNRVLDYQCCTEVDDHCEDDSVTALEAFCEKIYFPRVSSMQHRTSFSILSLTIVFSFDNCILILQKSFLRNLLICSCYI